MVSDNSRSVTDPDRLPAIIASVWFAFKLSFEPVECCADQALGLDVLQIVGGWQIDFLG